MGRSLRKEWEDNPFKELFFYYKDSDKEIRNEIVSTLLKLNKNGLNMVEYLHKDPCVYREAFVIIASDFCKSLNLKSTKSYYLAIDNLIKNKVLAKSKEVNFYFYNPLFFP
jgi:hypothetical protein